jgi:DNA-directed RNA polymerase subunit omega
MRDDYLAAALKVIDDPNILVNVVSRRVKQLKRGNRALIDSLEKLLPEDIALREIIEGKISYELPPPETPAEIEFREKAERERFRFSRQQRVISTKQASTLSA